MNPIEEFLLSSGLSWTMSKVLPYVLMVVIGIVLVVITKGVFRNRRALNRLVRLVLFFLPFGVYFAVAPIYEGDFSNVSTSTEKTAELAELTGKRLVVVSIPNCPFCKESVSRLKILKERLPDAIIEYRVCHSSDSSALDWYKETAGESILVNFAENSDALSTIAQGAYPTFVLVDGKKPLKAWSNNNFGVSAMDEVELALQ